jgi:DNA polymerase I-like protein with 3'-5' exonuclease and polymerase domains
MSNPNLQQIPASGYIGKKMREIFLPEEGMKWGSFDYSQQEPRIVAHYAIKYKLANTKGLKDKFEKENADFHQIVADLAKIPRKQAKTINLGLFYGMGKGKLQNELNLDQKQATNLLKLYHEKIPFIKELSDNLKNFAERERLIYTLEDRFCRFNFYESTNKRWDNKLRKFEEWDPKAKEIKQKDGTLTYQGDWIPPKLLTKKEAWDKFKSEFNQVSKKKIEEFTEEGRLQQFSLYYVPAFTYKALNRLIQGSAADMTKKAMVDLYEKGIIPHIQIHDELCISVVDDKQASLIKEIMETTIPDFTIKNKVDFESGPNWGTIK